MSSPAAKKRVCLRRSRLVANGLGESATLRPVTPEEFRVAGHQLIDWIADHRLSAAERPVRASSEPGEVASALPASAPTEVESFADVMSDLDSVVVPGMFEMQHPMHFGWFPANAELSSVLGDIASSGLSGLGISWESAPALTEVEEVVCDWMRQLVGLSDGWKGTITDTASTGCLTAMLAARERASDLSQNTGGLQSVASPLVVYTTAQAHSSVAKAALLAGYGWDNIVMVDTDPRSFAMLPEALDAAITVDIAAGKTPAVIVAAVGTTGTTAIDPVAEVVTIAKRVRAWVHVDAAMAGTAMMLPECRHLWEGVEGADSISWNLHKWMGTIMDCSLLYVQDTNQLQSVMSTNPSYLQSSADGAVTQYRDWGIPLGRRFRALKIWFQLRLDGVEAIQGRLRRDLDNAQWLAAQVSATPGWEVLAPVDLQTVCIRHTPVVDGVGLTGEALDDHTLAWVRTLNESGKAFLSPSMLDGVWMARVSIGTLATDRSHVDELWRLLRTTV